jgi:hypothetical protein
MKFIPRVEIRSSLADVFEKTVKFDRRMSLSKHSFCVNTTNDETVSRLAQCAINRFCVDLNKNVIFDYILRIKSLTN